MEKKRPSRAAYARKWYAENKDRIAAKIKREVKRKIAIKRQRKMEAGGKCSICGYDRCLSALHFHHPNGDGKGENPSIILMYYRTHKGTPVEEVIKKWVLVCANCHAEIHEKEGWRKAVAE